MSEPTPTNQAQFKCRWVDCGKEFKHSYLLQNHHRTHTKDKPFKCTFKSCGHRSTTVTHAYKHIRNVHHQEHLTAKKFVEVDKKILAEEEKLLGIKKTYREVKSDGDHFENATGNEPTLRPFTTIHRNSTGHYICPVEICAQQCNDFAKLKKHYQIHCGPDYRPYQCNITEFCQYASNLKKNVVKHIRTRHASLLEAKKNEIITAGNDDELDEHSAFININTDLLKKVNVLFSSAEIISSPEMQVQRPLYACKFPNCSMEFAHISHFRNHHRTHTQIKPFFCLFTNCNHTTNRKSTMMSHIHIHSFHFNIPTRNQKYLSNGDILKAEMYFGVKENVIKEERIQIAQSKICSGQKGKKRNRSIDNESFEDEYDDTDELMSLLATIRSTTFP